MEQHQPTLPAIIETGSTAVSIEELLEAVRSLPERLDDAQLALCDRIAGAPAPRFEPASGKHFAQCLKVLSRALPRRKADEEDGELWIRAYERMLGHMPAEQLSFISAKCLERFDWFPTVKQMLDIGKDWRGGEQAENLPALAAAKSDRERFNRLQEIRHRLKNEVVEQDWIERLSPGQRRVLETESLLLIDPETGGMVQHPYVLKQIRKWAEFLAAQGEAA